MKSTLSFFLSTQYLGGYSHCSSCVQLMAFKLLVSVRFVYWTCTKTFDDFAQKKKF